MSVVYYIGGPQDLHKVRINDAPKGDLEIVREFVLFGDTERGPKDHRYRVRPVGRDVFVALHESLW